MILSPEYSRQRLALIERKLRARVYADARPVAPLLLSDAVDRIDHDAATRLVYRPTSLGRELGPMWATFWLKADVEVPAAWSGRRLDLLFVSHSEATLWIDGAPRQGLNHQPYAVEGSTRPDAVLTPSARAGERLSFFVEIACNNFCIDPERVKKPYASKPLFVLDQVDVAAFDAEAWDLHWDFHVLRTLEDDAAQHGDRAWAGELLLALNDVANTWSGDDRRTWRAARERLAPLLAEKNAARGHRVAAVGHAHIDTAWVWPYAETMRKCVRTFSSQLAYMDAYPEHRFVCSQAVQWAWMKEQQPALWTRMVARAKEGRFLPVGGTWVEPDCNLPSGESLVRQFLYGQRFFRTELGTTCTEFWQPDVFGYNGQLPQIMKGAGASRFLTQKLSWNRFNRPTHHTLTWRGVDGTEVLAHFPPANTYNSVADVYELRRLARDFKDHGRSDRSLLLFGHGDGGGGPTKRMLEVLRRTADLLGVPKTTMQAPATFFDDVAAGARHLHTLVGELYFEYHRGTYTTQAECKRGNRRCEEALHDVELLRSVVDLPYPRAEIEDAWKRVLINQFHDVLPGSSIAEVYVDAKRDHDHVLATCAQLRDEALARLAPGGDGATPVNTLGCARREVARSPDGQLVVVDAPPCGVGAVVGATDAVAVVERADGWTLTNATLRVDVARDGAITSLVHLATGREALAGRAYALELYDDTPIDYDAWDVDPPHLETGRPCPPASGAAVVERGPLRAAVTFARAIGAASKATQTIRLDAHARAVVVECEVDWRESEKVLKAAFPLAVQAPRATYEMQFGVAERPTHFSNSFDLAQYEVPGHRFADLSEHGFGVAILSESKYGWSCLGSTMRSTLLRAPKMPDPDADVGTHRFAHAILPHAGGWQDGGVVDAARAFSQPVLWASGGGAPRSWFAVDGGLVIDSVKRAEDGDAIVVRLYEPHGGRGVARLRADVPWTRASSTNLLEEDGTPLPVEDGRVVVPYTPFRIVTVRLDR